MTKEELIKLGLTEEQALKIAEEQKKEMAAYVSKERFNEVNEAKKELESRISGYDEQLKGLKASADATEALKAKIADLEKANKTAQSDYETKLKDLRINSAIKLAIANTAQDVDIVAGLIDKDKLILGDDGKVTGLKEQVKALEKAKPFLFKTEQKPEYIPAGGKSPAKNPFLKETYNLTEQGKLLRADPAQARILAQAAGITI